MTDNAVNVALAPFAGISRDGAPRLCGTLGTGVFPWLEADLDPTRVHRIHVQASAPAKPAVGEPCNGCGVCCLSEPCPIGILITGRRRGACSALRWDQATSVYRCGVVTGAVPSGFAAGMASWPSGARAVWKTLSRRWIGAGTGCDCTLQTDTAPDGDSARLKPAA